MRKQTFWFFTWSSTNHAVQLKMMATGLKVQSLKAVRLYLEKNELTSLAVTANLICIFVFASAKCCFSHDAAQLFYP